MALGWTLPDFWDLWKAVSIGLTGLFGVLGLLTTYKDDATGRITGWGKLNLAGIIVSATMGVLAQLVDIQRSARSAIRSAEEAAASAALAADTAVQSTTAAENTEQLVGDLLSVSERTQRIAQGTERSVASSEAAARASLAAARRTEEIARGTERSVAASRAAALAGERAASATLGVAKDTSVTVATSQTALARVERLLSPFDSPELVIELNWSCPTNVRKVCLEQLRSGLGFAQVGIGARRPRIIGRRFVASELTYNGQPKVEGGFPFRRYSIVYPLVVDYNRSEVTSYLDLPGKTLFVTLGGTAITWPAIESLIIRTRDGRFILIPMTRATPIPGIEGRFSLEYAFPTDRDPRSRVRPAAAPTPG